MTQTELIQPPIMIKSHKNIYQERGGEGEQEEEAGQIVRHRGGNKVFVSPSRGEAVILSKETGEG